MGIRNYLIEGVSGTGKASVCKGLPAARLLRD
jgi:cytidylate kinase